MVAVATASVSVPPSSIKTMAERLRKASNNCAPEKMWAMLQAALAAPNVTGALAAACDVATLRCQHAGRPQRTDSEEEEEEELEVPRRRRRAGDQHVDTAPKTTAPVTAQRKQQPAAQPKDIRNQLPTQQRKAPMRSKCSLVLKSPKTKHKPVAKESASRKHSGQQSGLRTCQPEAKDAVPATKRELVDLGDFEDIVDLVNAWMQMRSSRDTELPRQRSQSKCGTEPPSKRSKREQPGRPKTEPAVKREQLANDIVRLGRKVIHGIIDLTEEECRQQRRPRQQQQQQQQGGASSPATSRKMSATKRPPAITKLASEPVKKVRHQKPKAATPAIRKLVSEAVKKVRHQKPRVAAEPVKKVMHQKPKAATPAIRKLVSESVKKVMHQKPKTAIAPTTCSPPSAVRKAAAVPNPLNLGARASPKDSTPRPQAWSTKVPKSPSSSVQQAPPLATKRKCQPGSEMIGMAPKEKSSLKACGNDAKTSDAVKRLYSVSSKCPPQKLWSILRAAAQAPGTGGINAALEEACKVAEPRCRRITHEED